jgi:hypothetical protein
LPQPGVEKPSLRAYPNPNPTHLLLELVQAADSVRVKLYSVAHTLVLAQEHGPLPAGRSHLQFSLTGLGNGRYSAVAFVDSGQGQATRLGPIKIYLSR